MSSPSDAPQRDELNRRIGVLTRRETEARILAPLIDALGAEFGRERVLEVLRESIINIARGQGAAMAQQMGSDELGAFADTLPAWTQDDALRIETLRQDERAFHFNVTRCRYAEMYRALGIPELGALLSCNRDFALIEGFNPDVQLERSQTIMQGATHCDFRYSLPVREDEATTDSA